VLLLTDHRCCVPTFSQGVLRGLCSVCATAAVSIFCRV
jgi:hypothetical protein